MQEALFRKNLNALRNPILKQTLSNIKQSKFKLIVGKNELDVNLLDEGGGGGDVSKSLKRIEAEFRALQ
ncbi:hypothetical protein [Campylobacter helveticus]|uniref:Uncharacterized protein n=1 Tax=Campylobacter helveticus TaxID=28898 RepID=A0ABY3L114_9BACT|nr:hypothetical protein [Campylobacter helveticus]TXK56758.1 hypothetical protein FVD16_05810 [Campylobacter helveticus]